MGLRREANLLFWLRRINDANIGWLAGGRPGTRADELAGRRLASGGSNLFPFRALVEGQAWI